MEHGADEAASLDLENFLPYRLNRLAEAVSRDFQTIYRTRYGLTRPEWRLLASLGQHGTMTATEVGRDSAMHKTKVSRAVSALEERRWLQRETDPEDRRVERLALTPPGAKAYAELVPLARRFEADLLRTLDPAEREALSTGLAAIERRFGGL